MMNSFNHILGGQSARSFLPAKSCNKKWTKQGTIFQREENHSDVTLGLQSYSKTICLVGEYVKNYRSNKNHVAFYNTYWRIPSMLYLYNLQFTTLKGLGFVGHNSRNPAFSLLKTQFIA